MNHFLYKEADLCIDVNGLYNWPEFHPCISIKQPSQSLKQKNLSVSRISKMFDVKMSYKGTVSFPFLQVSHVYLDTRYLREITLSNGE